MKLILSYAMRLCLFVALCSSVLHAQTVQPLIAEYTDHGAGTFVVTNSSFSPMAVVLEPRSFSIDAEGNGSYRQLDPGIQLELSSTSLRLGPRESQTVFYKVSAAKTPVWLTIYATFSQLHAAPGLNVRVMLPHTIYIYSKEPLTREAIRVDRVEYDPELRRVTCQLTNTGAAAGRAEGVEVSAGRQHVNDSGFPLLPGGTRRIVLKWTGERPPSLVTISFPRFTLKLPVAAAGGDGE